MKIREKDAAQIREELFERYPSLAACREEILAAYDLIRGTYQDGGQMLVAGNGGSAADAEHIVGELMKSFLFNREIDPDVKAKVTRYGEEGAVLAGKLEGALPAVPLTSMPALTTAITNDADATIDFAQKLYGYGRKGDVFLGITTSGNSKNIIYAMMVAKAKGIRTVALTGGTGGKCKGLADVTIVVPERETFKIQELHLPVYHAICAMLEADLFEEKKR